MSDRISVTEVRFIAVEELDRLIKRAAKHLADILGRETTNADVLILAVMLAMVNAGFRFLVDEEAMKDGAAGAES